MCNRWFLYACVQGHSKHEMWMRLCDLCAKHPEEVTGVLKVCVSQREKENEATRGIRESKGERWGEEMLFVHLLFYGPVDVSYSIV